MGERQPRVERCKDCQRQLVTRRWGRPKRFCSRWHRLRYWLEQLGDLVLG
ncbi:hypothetical protein ACFV7Q_34905 [Streptomyces sp. NPDC059851]